MAVTADLRPPEPLRRVGSARPATEARRPAPPERVSAPRRPGPITIGPSGDAVERQADALAAGSPGLGGTAHAAPGMAAKPAVAQALGRLEAGGTPIAPAIRRPFERRYGSDLSAVRIHDDPAADRVAHELGARAFTIGDHIGFASGEYAPATPPGRRMLAHELAHVVQQRRGAPVRVQRVIANDAATRAERAAFTPTQGRLVENRTILFDEVLVPPFKLSAHRLPLYLARQNGPGLKRARGYNRSESGQGNDQVRRWELAVQRDGAELVDVLKSKAQHEYALPAPPESGTFHVTFPKADGQPDFATFRAHSKRAPRKLARPMWEGGATSFVAMNQEVDHIVELQLAGFPGDRSANTVPNMELLAGGPNGASGNMVKNVIRDKVKLHLGALGLENPSGADVDWVLDNYTIAFSTARSGVRPNSDGTAPSFSGSVSRAEYWRFEEIIAGQHLGPVDVVDRSFTSASRQGTVRVLLDAADLATAVEYRWSSADTGQVETRDDEKRLRLPGDRVNKIEPLEITHKEFLTGVGAKEAPDLGKLWLQVPEQSKLFEPLEAPLEVTVQRKDDARFAGVLDVAALLPNIDLRAKALSPIDFSARSFDRHGGLQLSGVVQPDFADGPQKLTREGVDAGPRVEIGNGEVDMAGDLPADALDPPGPVEILSSSITFSTDRRGSPQVDGAVELQIRDLAEGEISASLSANGFRLAGSLSAETQFFQRGTIRAEYDSELGFSGGADLVLHTANLPGVQSARIQVSIQQSQWTVSGEAGLELLGIEGTAIVGWSEAEGLTVGARIPIPEGKLPGVRGGFLEASIIRRPDGTISFGARGQAEPAIPGIDSTVDLEWRDGILTAAATVAFARDQFRGSLEFGLTNLGLDENGQPTGEPAEGIRAFGGGTLGARFGPIEAEVGARINPLGEPEFAATAAFDEQRLFRPLELTRRIFALDIEVPIAGITVAGRGLGIFAFVGGGLDLTAGVGPGMLRDAVLGIQYNPAQPNETVVTGSAELFVPASAGIRLFVRAGIGGSLVIADVRGGLEIGGELGISAEARARADLQWTPAAGVRIELLAEALGRPVLTFDVTGFAEVSAFLVGTVWEERYTGLTFRLPSGLEVGIRARLVITDQGVQFDANNVEFIFPNVDFRRELERQLTR